MDEIPEVEELSRVSSLPELLTSQGSSSNWSPPSSPSSSTQDQFTASELLKKWGSEAFFDPPSFSSVMQGQRDISEGLSLVSKSSQASSMVEESGQRSQRRLADLDEEKRDSASFSYSLNLGSSTLSHGESSLQTGSAKSSATEAQAVSSIKEGTSLSLESASLSKKGEDFQVESHTAEGAGQSLLAEANTAQQQGEEIEQGLPSQEPSPYAQVDPNSRDIQDPGAMGDGREPGAPEGPEGKEGGEKSEDKDDDKKGKSEDKQGDDDNKFDDDYWKKRSQIDDEYWKKKSEEENKQDGPGNSGNTPGAGKGKKVGWNNPHNPHYQGGDNDSGKAEEERDKKLEQLEGEKRKHDDDKKKKDKKDKDDDGKPGNGPPGLSGGGPPGLQNKGGPPGQVKKSEGSGGEGGSGPREVSPLSQSDYRAKSSQASDLKYQAQQKRTQSDQKQAEAAEAKKNAQVNIADGEDKRKKSDQKTDEGQALKVKAETQQTQTSSAQKNLNEVRSELKSKEAEVANNQDSGKGEWTQLSGQKEETGKLNNQVAELNKKGKDLIDLGERERVKGKSEDSSQTAQASALYDDPETKNSFKREREGIGKEGSVQPSSSPTQPLEQTERKEKQTQLA